MSKISFYDIATVLVEQYGLEPEVAGEFVKTMFDIIQERLTIEQQVKVKGLGTFKVVNVDARESVNVNTGERFVIDGHQKLSFVPDTSMKELINKPFSQFETVILNDGVDFNGNATQAQDGCGEESPSRIKQVMLHILYVLVIAALSAWGGYWYGTNHAGGNKYTGNTPKATQQTAKAVKAIPAAKPAATKADTTAAAAKQDTVKQQPKATGQQSEKAPENHAKTAPEDYAKYAKMDARVRTGAYNIVGEDFTVAARKGETISHLAKRTLGNGMECYIEVFNGMPQNAPLTEGQKIKIPKLKLKKRK